jgi:hypothetical protein
MGVKHKRRNDVLHGNESDKLETMQQSPYVYSGEFGRGNPNQRRY